MGDDSESATRTPGMSRVEKELTRCTREVIRQRRSQLKSDHRVTLRRSGADWLTVQVRTVADLDLVTELVALAEQAHRPAPGQPAKPVPDGEELERRRRFH